MKVGVQRPGPALAAGAAPGPIAAIDALLRQKPNARIAIVQGSFDWFHSGHLELVSQIAQAELRNREGKQERYDLVVVIPTFEYERKPYLRGSFGRRLALAEQAVAADPSLKGRVVVSDAMKQLPNRPTEVMRELTKVYPSAQFAYCLGADSFNESADRQRWAQFDFVEQHPRIELVATERGGYQVDRPARARHVIRQGTTTVSSGEIRSALYANDLASLAGRVPPSTMVALQAEQARLAAARRSGPGMLGLTRPSELSFAALRQARPPGAVDLLFLLEEQELPELTRQHLATLQQRINEQAAQLAHGTFSLAAQQLDATAGLSDKRVLNAHQGVKRLGRFLHKPMAPEIAAKVEFITILANLVGVATPLALRHGYQGEGAVGSGGVSLKLIDEVEEARVYDFKKAKPAVLEYLVLSRWLNEVVGNLDCWGAQFLVPKGRSQRYDDVLNIDLDEAFQRLPPETLYRALTEHFGLKEVTMADCQWRSRPYDFEQPVGWAPEHYDSKFTVYGPLFRDYLRGDVELDLDRIKAQLRQVLALPRSAVLNSMQSFLQVSAAQHDQAVVELPAAPVPLLSKADFERRFQARLYASIEQFCGFLDQLQAARRDPSNPIYQHHHNLGKRPY